VVDNVGVLGGAAGMGLQGTTAGTTFNNSNLPATSRPSESNTMFLNTTNPSGF